MLPVEEHGVSSSKLYVIDRSIQGSRRIIASYLLVGPTGGAALIDPGPGNGYEELTDTLSQLLGNGRLEAVLLTHIHLDHAGASGHLARIFKEASIYVHPRGAPHLADPSRLWVSSLEILGDTARLYGEPLPIPENRLKVPRDGETIDVGGTQITVIYTPGHASHHMSFMAGDLLFAGDSAGTFQCSSLFPTTPFPFKLVDALESLDRMRELRPRRIAYTHFGIQEPAVEMLSLYRSLLVELAELVWSLMKRGVEPDEIPRHVDRATGMVTRYRECMESLGAWYVEDHILQSLEGIRRFLERFGPQHRGAQL